MTYKEIASEMGLAHSTVRVQVAEIRKRLGQIRIPVLRQPGD
jgi:DNA-binding NarL/FixJ family response regulator